MTELDCDHPSDPPSDSAYNFLPASMTVEKPTRNPKTFRRQLVIDFEHENNRHFLNNDDNESHEFETNHTNLSNEAKHSSPISSIAASSISPRNSPLRTIRRKRRLSIVRPCTNPEVVVKPITISLPLGSSGIARMHSPKVPSTSVCVPAEVAKKDLALESTASADSATRPPTCPQIPDTPPVGPLTSLIRPSSPNVRLGHPTRPYYSAIRKQGISPPSSRPSSIGSFAHATPPPSIRPKSYSPPSPPSPKNVPASSTNRHWSLSAIPPSPSGIFSVFSLDEAEPDDEEENNRKENVQLTPTKSAPIPSRLSFGVSFASAAKSLSRKRSASLGFAPSSFPNKSSSHKQTYSISCLPFLPPLSTTDGQSVSPCGGSFDRKGFKINAPASEIGTAGAGFSVSGETELKMALALAEVQKVSDEDKATRTSATRVSVKENVAFSTTPHPPPSPSLPPALPSSSLQATMDTSLRKSFASRVKRLRKGLKDMLVMTSHGNN